MRIINYLVFFIFLSNHAMAQNNERNELIEQLEKEYRTTKTNGTSTDEAIETLQELKTAASKINYSEGMLKYNIELMNGYIKRADYNNALKLKTEIEILAKKQKDYKALSVLHGRIGEIQNIAGHYEQALEEARKSLCFAQKVTDYNKRCYQISFASMQLVTAFKEKNQDSVLFYAQKSLANLEKINTSETSLYQLKQSGILFTHMYLGSFYTNNYKPQRLDLAEMHYMKAYDFKEKDPNFFLTYDLPLLNALGIFYIEKGAYEKAIDFAYEALEIEKKKKSPDERALSFMTLANAYEKLNQTNLQLKYTKKYTLLSDSLNTVEKRTHETLLQQAVETSKHKNESADNKPIFKVILLVISLGLMIGGLLVYRKIQTLLLVASPSKTPSKEVQENTETQEHLTSTSNIADKTIQTLLKKLDRFEDSEKYLRNDVNLTWLANHLNTNPKYLSEIIKQHKAKNFNNYINALRIQYIVEKLEKTPEYREYKISYLAQECGYASSQVFVIAFKKEMGMPPSNFIEKLNDAENLP